MFVRFLRFITLVSIVIIVSSCSESIKPKKKTIKVDNLVSNFKITGKNNFEASVLITKVNPNSANHQFKAQIKIFAKSKLKIDTTFKTASLKNLYSSMMPILYKIPFEKSQSVNFKYENKKFEEISPVEGSEIDTILLMSFITNKKKEKNVLINLEKEKLYVQPRYTIDSLKAKDGLKSLEKCLKSVIKLKYEDKEFDMDKEIFATWLHLDTSMKVKIETDPMQVYLQKIAEKIETPLSEILAEVDLTDSLKMNEVIFSRVNINNQINEILKLIPKGDKSNLELIMTKRGLPKGIKKGHKDFVEVSISEQKLWLFKEGNLILETDVVTGNKRYGRSTPPGDYKVLYKERNRVLRGRGYASFVSYWMPFYGGYGLHDANWRRRFGANIYESGGSHGCVNIPPKLAPIVYNNVSIGTPVLIY